MRCLQVPAAQYLGLNVKVEFASVLPVVHSAIRAPHWDSPQATTFGLAECTVDFSFPLFNAGGHSKATPEGASTRSPFKFGGPPSPAPFIEQPGSATAQPPSEPTPPPFPPGFGVEEGEGLTMPPSMQQDASGDSPPAPFGSQGIAPSDGPGAATFGTPFGIPLGIPSGAPSGGISFGGFSFQQGPPTATPGADPAPQAPSGAPFGGFFFGVSSPQGAPATPEGGKGSYSTPAVSFGDQQENAPSPAPFAFSGSGFTGFGAPGSSIPPAAFSGSAFGMPAPASGISTPAQASAPAPAPEISTPEHFEAVLDAALALRDEEIAVVNERVEAIYMLQEAQKAELQRVQRAIKPFRSMKENLVVCVQELAERRAKIAEENEDRIEMHVVQGRHSLEIANLKIRTEDLTMDLAEEVARVQALSEKFHPLAALAGHLLLEQATPELAAAGLAAQPPMPAAALAGLAEQMSVVRAQAAALAALPAYARRFEALAAAVTAQGEAAAAQQAANAAQRAEAAVQRRTADADAAATARLGERVRAIEAQIAGNAPASSAPALIFADAAAQTSFTVCVFDFSLCSTGLVIFEPNYVLETLALVLTLLMPSPIRNVVLDGQLSCGLPHLHLVSFECLRAK